MFDALVEELSDRYGLGDRGRDLFGLLMAYIHNDRRGGFGGFVEAFREQGHGELISSWLGNAQGENSLNASDVGMVFGQGLLNDWGSRLGVSRATVAAAIGGVLPRLVAELTPGGRIPGGFAPVTRRMEAGTRQRSTPRAATETEHRDADFDAGAGVDVDHVNAADRRSGHDWGKHDVGTVVPGEEHDDASSAPSAPLRREPRSGPVAPREAQQARAAAAVPLDPAEQRIADMTAALDSQPPARDRRPDNWRPAVHHPKKKRRRHRWLAWLMWLIVLAAVIAAGVWYAWTVGLLDLYIRQFNLAVPLRNPTG